MTLEEKASLCSGLNNWFTKPVKSADVPSIMMTDGPHGLRKQSGSHDHLGINLSEPATCFPAGCATAASFDTELLEEVGRAIGEECIKEDVSIVLGPGANIKRSPLCGRNFEYFSEDPYLASKMAAAHIRGVQETGVGTSLKHFAVNNQEAFRMTIDVKADERTLREIYLAAFEGAVKEGKPATVMCSYNRINEEYASENEWLLTELLRDEWGFEGFVMSDWGAVNDRVKGLAAGLDLEMPASGGANDARIVEAVKAGKLDEKLLDTAVERILRAIYELRVTPEMKKEHPCDMEAHNGAARRIASECSVLLKNEGGLFPTEKDLKVAFVGEFFEKPRFQGGGSSHINPYKVTSAIDCMDIFPKARYAKGYSINSDDTDEALLAEAVKLAAESDLCVVFAGLPDRIESEGYDRKHMRLPDNQNSLIDEISRVQPNTAVVLHNGSPVEMPWIGSVKTILEAYLGGQAVGAAVMDIISGAANPCGKLPETFPLRLQDNPSYINFPGDSVKVEYREGVFVGYRYYDAKEAEVLFPFGHGLSYTEFEYSNLRVSGDEVSDAETVTVSADIKNTGSLAGKEAAQLYVAPKAKGVLRPVKELKGFAKVSLKPGEVKTVSFTLNKRSFAHYDAELTDWRTADGVYGIQVAASSRDIKLEKDIVVHPAEPYNVKLTVNSPVAAFMSNEKGRALAMQLLEGSPMFARKDAEKDGGQNAEKGDDEADGKVAGKSEEPESDGLSDMFAAMADEIPLRALSMFSGRVITQEELDAALG